MPTPVSPISQNIQSGQSFLVKSNGSAGSLVIKEGDKSATAATNVFGALAVNPSNLATNSSKMVQGIKINLKIVEDDQSTGLLDGVFVSFNNNFSNEIDDLDVIKPANINENFAIVKEGQALMVERRSIAIANETVQFKVSNVSERRYLLDIDPINLSFSGLYFYLRDNYLQTSTPINLDNSSQINFSVSKHDVSSGSNRFSLIISTTKLSTDILVSNGITTFPNPVKGRSINLRLINQPEGNYNVSIVNSLGQLVYNGQINHAGGSAIQSIYLKNKLTQGVYQLQVSKGSIKTSFKILSE
jgi:hypothetical protein